MRLIDADDLILTILTDDLCGEDNVDKAILNAPTIKAIPIEWIERIIKESLYDRYARYEDISAQVDTETMMKSLAILIERWEKENGIE